ncbi:MAG: GNAT family N-acetyltransferase [Porphyromonas sp.]|nr:GNAT family N-acetyltransferase [Porphyromonas sp.]
MQPIISPIDKSILRSELKPNMLLRKTNRADNEIYIFHAEEAPSLMREVGRLREEAFRYYGGGSGMETDTDKFDYEGGYRQIIVWDPDEGKILGGYRFICGEDVGFKDGIPELASAHMFAFSPEFIKDYLPYTIELGRSFVSLACQSTHPEASSLSSKSIFALDNLWDGVGALPLLYPNYRYFFGKVTMYKGYNRYCRDIIIYLLSKYYSDPKLLVRPIEQVPYMTPIETLSEILHYDTFEENYKAVNKLVREYGINIPPLINSYVQIAKHLVFYGTAINKEFSDVEESALLLPFTGINEDKLRRHVESFIRDCALQYRKRLSREDSTH